MVVWSQHGSNRRASRIFSLVAVIVCLGLATGLVAQAHAQRGGENWRPLISPLRAQVNAHPDPEVAFRLAMVYAHEGMLIDGWHMLKQVDQMVGGERHRVEIENRIIAHALSDVARDPRDLLARYSLAFASWLAGDHEMTLREFLEITRQDPKNAMNHGYLGYIYATRKDAKNTITQWEEGVRLDPSNNLLHYMLGSAYYRTGRTLDAMVQFNLAYRDRTLYDYITHGEEP